jgi:hypothetical protein
MNIYTLQISKVCPLIENFCMNMQKFHKRNKLPEECEWVGAALGALLTPQSLVDLAKSGGPLIALKPGFFPNSPFSFLRCRA